jgi:hypothetical protein
LSPCDVSLLTPFVSTAQQHDDDRSLSPKVDPISRTYIYPQLERTFAHPCVVTQIAQRETPQSLINRRLRSLVA